MTYPVKQELNKTKIGYHIDTIECLRIYSVSVIWYIQNPMNSFNATHVNW